MRASVIRRGRRREFGENSVRKKAELLVAPNESGDSENRREWDKDIEMVNSGTLQDTRLAMISIKTGTLPNKEIQEQPTTVVIRQTEDVVMNDLVTMREQGEAEKGKANSEKENAIKTARQEATQYAEGNLEIYAERQRAQAGIKVLQELDQNSLGRGNSANEGWTRTTAGKWKRMERQKGKE